MYVTPVQYQDTSVWPRGAHQQALARFCVLACDCYTYCHAAAHIHHFWLIHTSELDCPSRGWLTVLTRNSSLEVEGYALMVFISAQFIFIRTWRAIFFFCMSCKLKTSFCVFLMNVCYFALGFCHCLPVDTAVWARRTRGCVHTDSGTATKMQRFPFIFSETLASSCELWSSGSRWRDQQQLSQQTCLAPEVKPQLFKRSCQNQLHNSCVT